MRRLTRDPAELIPLKHSTYQVLLALGDGEAMHGYAIMQEVAAMTDGREAILPGTIYAALARIGVDEPDDVDAVLRMLDELASDQLSDLAGADDDAVLDVGQAPSCGCSGGDAARGHEAEGQRPEEERFGRVG